MSFTWTVFDRVKYGLSRLTYGMATWRGLDARKLAAETSAGRLTAAVVACRFPPGFGGPHAAKEWRGASVTFAHTHLEFAVGGRRTPSVVEISAGTHRLRVAHDGPPPYLETTVDVAAGQTVLIEVLPGTEWVWFPVRSPRLVVSSGDDELVAEHEL